MFQMVPVKEMTDVLKVVKETANLKPKTWVRLKRGVFKDDLAQVGKIISFLLIRQVGQTKSLLCL